MAMALFEKKQGDTPCFFLFEHRKSIKNIALHLSNFSIENSPKSANHVKRN